MDISTVLAAKTWSLGSVAEWLAALTTLFSAIAVVVMAKRTNQLAEASNEVAEGANRLAHAANELAVRSNVIGVAANRIAESVQEIELSRDANEDASRDAEKTLILITLFGAIGHATAAVEAVQRTVSGETGVKFQDMKPGDIAMMCSELQRHALHVPDSVRSRLHLLDLETAGRILRSEIGIQMIGTHLNSMISAALHAGAEQQLLGALAAMSDDLGKLHDQSLDAMRSAGLIQPAQNWTMPHH